MVDVAVYGARGYLGRVLAGLLWHHPEVKDVHPVSSEAAGTPYGQAVPTYRHREEALVGPDDPVALGADVVFLASPSGEAKRLLPQIEDSGAGLIIDLSRDHRGHALAGEQPWVYGLPELFPALTQGVTHVANPGCYPTASLLGLAPLLIAGLTAPGPIIVDGKSGVSGAGATPRPDLHFPETHESLRAYKVLGHDHTEEIKAGSARLVTTGRSGQGGRDRPVRFTPHLVPQNRGLLVTAYLPAIDGVTQDEVAAAYEKVYAYTPLVRLVDEPDTAHVRGTQFADVACTLDEATGILVVRSAIDNLVRGGAGTAVQNMNITLGLEPGTGLPTTGGGP